MFGVIGTLILMQVKLYREGYDEYKIWDRAYRLQNSLSQNRADLYSFHGALVGGLAGILFGLPKKRTRLSGGRGAMLGIPLALLAHVLQPPPKSEHELEIKKKEEEKKTTSK
ncbi:unnamed protein product [Didymodactylos carnosus]|uniref:Uncharacterized protein n=2 Tax=Didymodactylos carnosus TaxID=1234261 RepID=A0A816GKG5_9BILA|nr:unnamed protein product [Didymodactylos carnosus]CAF4665054.1 unnamed protein product [Didymodactylos carnosus]